MFEAIKNFFKESGEGVGAPAAEGEVISLADLHNFNPYAYAGQTQLSNWEYSIFDGGKFPGGFGPTQIQYVDYWTIRARSAQLFNENLYAKGIIRRLVTNIINTGLMPEASPDEAIIGVPEDSLNEWSDNVEVRFGLWGQNPKVCDWKQKSTWGAIQRKAYLEALVEGDILVVLRVSKTTGLPAIQLVPGRSVRTPLLSDMTLRRGHTVEHGVELDSQKRQVAYWVQQEDLSYKRIPAFGVKTKRRMAWLVYGTENRLDEVRGQPLLSVVLQSLKEIDRYRDSTQRKALINSLYTMFIKKTENKMGSLPVQGGAIRRGTVTTSEDGEPRKLNVASQMPGVILDELQVGEEPELLGGQGTDLNFPGFEEAIIQAISWSVELPPEIATLSFSNNYSASQAAINELKITINLKWGDFGESFCTPIYIEYMLSETLRGKINAPSLLKAWRDPNAYDVFGAWTSVDWYGSIKPSTDMVKQTKGSESLVKNGWSTNAREARVTTGTKFSKNLKRLKRENEQLVEARRPLAEFEQEFGSSSTDGSDGAGDAEDQAQALGELLDEYLEEHGTGDD